MFFLAGSSAPTPLYALYQSEWHFSPITTTVVFGVYALAVLASLLVVGSLSDHIGRRPVLLAAIITQALTMLIFIDAHGVGELLAARILQGLATGAAAGAVGAGLLDLNRTGGTVANAVSPMTGTALGALGSSLLVQYLPAPARTIYWLLFAVFVVQAVGVRFMAESATPRAGALGSLRPQFVVPSGARRPLLLGVPAVVALWALAGLYGSLGPAVVRLIAGSDSTVLGGSALFVLAATGAVAVLLLQRSSPHAIMILGTTALLLGVGLSVLAINITSIALFFLGTAVAGVGFGSSFQGVVRTVIPHAAAHERAGLLSVVYVVSYLAMGLPAVIAGFLVVHGGGVLTTAREYGLVVMVLAAVALLGTLATHYRSRLDRRIATRAAVELCG